MGIEIRIISILKQQNGAIIQIEFCLEKGVTALEFAKIIHNSAARMNARE